MRGREFHAAQNGRAHGRSMLWSYRAKGRGKVESGSDSSGDMFG